MAKNSVHVEEPLDNDAAARFLGCKPGTLRVWVSKKKVPHIRVGRLVRFDPAALRDFLQSHSVAAQN